MTKSLPRVATPTSLPKVVVIIGPTAAGKTALSVEIAKKLGGEVVSADSRQVYRGLDIGSGKITKKEMRGVPHHLLDVANPNTTFSAAEYVRLGRRAIQGIALRGRVPLIVGGTGFYIDALLGRVQLAEVAPDPALRLWLSAFSVKELNAQLKKLDPQRAKKIDTKNRVRLVRAIEIARALGSVPYMGQKELYKTLWIGLTLPQETLAQKIHIRLFARIRGIEREIKNLHKKGLSWKRMEELGLEYRYMARYLQGKISQGEMHAQLEIEIRKYAKRQMTWFKRNKEIRWFTPNQKKEIVAITKKFLKMNYAPKLYD
ncbi:tRNA (adenosine(37)-N6)-dimethylallyltransferase MiaA [Candidatus Kaiserbacteria bacterium RIFCSPHIGHO2_01_FULL_48_10]|uniref:tRNA dimethylallyltransferase n=1 Tax=Candidatus Kaiserbacteria bacterium RIFCSPHIGHO2_01_FULL_48_10 TaxID=1798476 RepID=A0A1F6C679_9BACT|nr:MAG: tRNA (adenosine(37)-N6)-dimethylallyltransferase MiaA [Candidatus Kaiserbacteria bacterium RIFCSPHIGHO2_01_FULL_48_10]